MSNTFEDSAMEEMIEALVSLAPKMYNKFAESPEVFRAYARCLNTGLKVLMEEGFTREEALSIAANFIGNIGKK